MTYFNTTRETDQLDLIIKINEGQDKDVLIVIRSLYSDKPFSSKDIFKYFEWSHDKTILITSIRRSINTLKRAGYIQETGERVPGLYGRSELQYKLVK